MSLWWCPACKAMCGGSNANITCPVCSTPLEYARIGQLPGEPPQTIQTVSWNPKSVETLCWCQTLRSAGMHGNQKCEPCIRREHAVFKSQLQKWVDVYTCLPRPGGGDGFWDPEADAFVIETRKLLE